ncbi:hypothetical protein [Zavarzinella formosa]|uniref:hypothetical protein n=1 Tax=Zavarzinella formosa TaxID=360055 RepID=UPI000494F66B|nr:hypothetical protein [Zavarzinella formosa]
MRDVNRRDVVRFVAGLAAGTGLMAASEASAKDPKPPADPELELALSSLGTFMFAEQLKTKIDDNGPGRDVVITSAIADGKSTHVYLRSNSVRIFRADANVDDFTKKGGVHWYFGDTKGKIQFKNPGALIMVMRDEDGIVRWYSLGLDFRC